VLEDPAFAEELRTRGLRHAQSFTWDAAARRYYDAYRRVADKA
jgi:glycosyltransferase involved in cell wall biosynthesis